jgi:pSer/pThr/pTyr-binding forkhead associated (FHA) protein/LysM repeat protein
MKRYIIALLNLIFLICAVQMGYTQVQQTSPVDMVFAIDNSDSMKTNDPEFLASKTVLSFLDHLSVDSRIGLVIFDESPKLAMPLTTIAEAGIREKIATNLAIMEGITRSSSEAITKVTVQKGDTLWELANKYYGDPFKWNLIAEANNISNPRDPIPVGIVLQIPVKGPKGRIGGKEYTNIPEAVERAIYELREDGRPDSGKLIVLMTDGILDIEDSAREVERYRWLKDELTLESKKAGIQIFGIAFTEQADFELMQTLAQKTDGSYYRVFKAEDIQGVISRINASGKPGISAEAKPQPVAEKVKPAKKGTILSSLRRGAIGPWMALLGVVLGLLAISSAVAVTLMRRPKRPKKVMKNVEVEMPEACLMDMDGITGKKTYMINSKTTTIGRENGDNADIQIPENTVSAVHAQIRYRDDDFYLADLGSKNGTYLNEEEEPIVSEVRLKSGDTIIFDQFRFKFLVRGQSERAKKQEDQTSQDREQVSHKEPVEVPRMSEDERGKTQLSQRKRGKTQLSQRRPSEKSEETSPDNTAPVVSMDEKDTDQDAQDAVQSPASPGASGGEVPDTAVPEAYLMDLDGTTGKDMHMIDKSLVKVGRAKTDDVDIHIGRSTISSKHAQIQYKDHGFHLTDLGSSNGTFLNKERITSQVPLNSEDIISFDQYKFKFVVCNPEKQA